MQDISQIDLGSSILSIVLIMGFVAFGFLVLRVLLIGISAAFKKIRGNKQANG